MENIMDISHFWLAMIIDTTPINTQQQTKNMVRNNIIKKHRKVKNILKTTIFWFFCVNATLRYMRLIGS